MPKFTEFRETSETAENLRLGRKHWRRYSRNVDTLPLSPKSKCKHKNLSLYLKTCSRRVPQERGRLLPGLRDVVVADGRRDRRGLGYEINCLGLEGEGGPFFQLSFRPGYKKISKQLLEDFEIISKIRFKNV